MIDGHDLRDVTLDSVRAQVATVLQADLVFTDSVLVNIGLGDPMNTLPRIIEAAKMAHAHHFIQDLPHGYDTTIGPLGHYLKPDEQFRIALARAYLHDPSILIVEEPNAADRRRHQALHRRHAVAAVDRPHADHHAASAVDRPIVRPCHRPAQRPGRGRRARRHSFRPRASCSATCIYTEFNEFATGEIEAGQMNHGEAAPQDGLELIWQLRRMHAQQQSSTVGLMTSSGTWARGGARPGT